MDVSNAASGASYEGSFCHSKPFLRLANAVLQSTTQLSTSISQCHFDTFDAASLISSFFMTPLDLQLNHNFPLYRVHSLVKITS